MLGLVLWYHLFRRIAPPNASLFLFFPRPAPISARAMGDRVEKALFDLEAREEAAMAPRSLKVAEGAILVVEPLQDLNISKSPMWVAKLENFPTLSCSVAPFFLSSLAAPLKNGLPHSFFSSRVTEQLSTPVDLGPQVFSGNSSPRS